MKTAFSVPVIFSLMSASYLIWPPAPSEARWGPDGHEISARAAVRGLPSTMPAFFREAIDQLVYLSFEPDRWRDFRESSLDPALGGGHGPDHYLNLEIVPPGALQSEDRHDFVDVAGDGPAVGVLPFRMLELFQRVRLGFRMWREEEDAQVRGWIEQRIVNDAGILGHYVADAANPLHATLHFDGWVGDNPAGYATDDGIHRRFESDYVRARLTLDDVVGLMNRPPRIWENPRQEIRSHIEESFEWVEPLYRIDRDLPFSENLDSETHRRFTAERLAAGALALRDAWWSAWATSAP